MRRESTPEDLLASWTLVEDDWRLVSNKTGATRLGFAALLKFFELEGRCPRHAAELPRQAVDYLAQQLRVAPDLLVSYVWTGLTIEYHRGGLPERARRGAAARGAAGALSSGASRAARPEPGRPGTGGGQADAEQRFCAQPVERPSAEAIERLEELAGAGREDGAGGRGLLAELKANPGPLGLETLLSEIAKLGRVRANGLPPDLFASASEKLVAAWRVRAAMQYPSHFQAMAQPVRLTLLAALRWQRAAEITDGLVDLLILLVHRINARAESRVEGEMVVDLRPVAGKQGILFRLAGAALEQPDETVRRAIYPVVGERTLRDLVREAMANEAALKRRIRPRALYGRLGTGRSRSRPPRRAPNRTGLDRRS